MRALDFLNSQDLSVPNRLNLLSAYKACTKTSKLKKTNRTYKRMATHKLKVEQYDNVINNNLAAPISHTKC